MTENPVINLDFRKGCKIIHCLTEFARNVLFLLMDPLLVFSPHVHQVGCKDEDGCNTGQGHHIDQQITERNKVIESYDDQGDPNPQAPWTGNDGAEGPDHVKVLPSFQNIPQVFKDPFEDQDAGHPVGGKDNDDGLLEIDIPDIDVLNSEQVAHKHHQPKKDRS